MLNSKNLFFQLKTLCKQLLLFAVLIFGFVDAHADSELLHSPGNKFVKASLVVDRESIQPGFEMDQSVALIGVNFEIEPGWHIYWKNSGEAALPTSITWSLPANWEAGHLNWPVPEKFVEQGDITTFGYSEQILLFSSLKTSEQNDGEVVVGAEVKWLVCKNICVPGRAKLEKTIRVSGTDALTASGDFELFKMAKNRVPGSSLPEEKFESVKFEGQSYLKFSLTAGALDGLSEKDFQYFPSSSENLSSRLGLFSDDPASLYFPENADGVDGVLSLSAQASTALGLPNQFEIKVSTEGQSRETNLLTTAPNLKPLEFKLVHYRDKEKSSPRKSEPDEKAVSLQPVPLKTGLFSALCFALLGGALLNFMPCVLPVLSIKAFSLVEKSEKSKTSRIKSAFAYFIGIELAFLTLAVAVLVLRGLGNHVGWGFQFQNPGFLVVLTVVVFALSLSFFGVYKLSFTAPGSKMAGAGGDGFLGDIVDGILITVLSTPCTAPFLGTALAFAFAAPGYGVFLIFAAIGLGLAFPYILLSASDSCQKLLPSPGNWMNTFKQLMGFFLVATVIWLISVYQSVSPQGVVSLLSLLFAVSLLLWLSSRSLIAKWWGKCLVLILCIFTGWLAISRWPTLVSTSSSRVLSATSELIEWSQYSPQLLVEAQSQSRPVFIDFTADWCVTCKANEKFVIETESVAGALSENNYYSLIADWTTADPEVSSALKKYGGTGVPHYVVLDRDGKVSSILGSVVTAREMSQALIRAAELSPVE